ncbi:hypothetical protein D7X74_12980 [Corallococcus sp. CA047B]|nr:hypothetical protein D7X74_12980 [Corallococcus sp. CA047B]
MAMNWLACCSATSCFLRSVSHAANSARSDPSSRRRRSRNRRFCSPSSLIVPAILGPTLHREQGGLAWERVAARSDGSGPAAPSLA